MLLLPLLLLLLMLLLLRMSLLMLLLQQLGVMLLQPRRDLRQLQGTCEHGRDMGSSSAGRSKQQLMGQHRSTTLSSLRSHGQHKDSKAD